MKYHLTPARMAIIKKINEDWGGVARVAELLPSKHEALSSNPSTVGK
jgi:hypothetical protein